MSQLPQDDIDFLNNLGDQLGANEIPDDALAGLRAGAAAGDPTAISLLGVVETAQATQHLFNAESQKMMLQAATVIRLRSPILTAMYNFSTNRQFTEQLAVVLDTVMRDAFARGWLAHEAETKG